MARGFVNGRVNMNSGGLKFSLREVAFFVREEVPCGFLLSLMYLLHSGRVLDVFNKTNRKFHMLRPLLLALAAAPAGGLASPGASQLRPRVTLSRCTPLTCLGQTSDAAAAAAAAPPLTAALTGAAPRDAPSVAPSPASLLEDNAAALLACALALVALSVTPAHAASAAAVVPSATAATTAAAAAASATPLTFSQVLEKAGKRALGGGLSGALAGVAQAPFDRHFPICH